MSIVCVYTQDCGWSRHSAFTLLALYSLKFCPFYLHLMSGCVRKLRAQKARNGFTAWLPVGRVSRCQQQK